MHRKCKLTHKCPSQEKDSIVHPKAIPLSLSCPHQTSLQILLTKLSKSTLNLTILAASISNSNHHFLSPGASWLVSWLPFWLHSPFPHWDQSDQISKKPIRSYHSLLSPSSDFLLYWEQDPKSSSWSIRTYFLWSWPPPDLTFHGSPPPLQCSNHETFLLLL